jgi:site-specific DNA-methyltransferase (adenine-specific)
MEGMAKYPDKYFDLAIVDPPYGINITDECMGNRKTIPRDKTKKWDTIKPDYKYFTELFRISVNQVIFGGNYFNLPISRYFFIWDKGETMYGRDFAECEFAWVRFGGTRIYKKTPNQLDRIHPTQKPVALYKWLLDKYAKPGDKILDTHLGSGSSRIAAYELGFYFTGYELDKEYFDLQEKRYKNHTAQLKIFTQ